MKYLTWIAVLLVALVAVGTFADDGEMLRRNIPSTPELETEHAALTMLELYVPARTSAGDLLEFINYVNAEGAEVETRESAKPLIAYYQDGHVEEVEGVGFSGHGERDAFAAVSLDDGETWKRSNLSKSGDLSSFSIKVKNKWVPYAGDVVRLFAADDGNKALLVWASRYCTGGSPTYALTTEELDALDVLVGESDGVCQPSDETDFESDLCPYLEDYWGVSGSQGSSDFADEGYPEVGEVPFSCMWAARGTLEPVDPVTGLFDDTSDHYEMIWRKAERLTSGRRDAHRMEAACVEGAGCVVTWQEDPDGMRPGEGEGPGEGWSGAIAHHQTDTWYSYISWDSFDLVDDGEDDYLGVPIPFAEFDGEGVPQVGIPMSIPIRLTDNAMCVNDGLDDPYCYIDFDGSGTPDFCATSVTVTAETPEGPTQEIDMCITEDGRLTRGNTASTRPRTNLRGYDTDDDGVLDRAWVIMAYEENKGLGEEAVEAAEAAGLDPSSTLDMTKVDMGKNIWYHTFDMFEPELVSQGLMLNQPAVYPELFEPPAGSLQPESTLGYNFMTIDPDPIYETQAGIDTTLYQTEIARRFSLISQEADEFGESRTVALAMWKQGIVRRGGPADVMARRFVVPEEFNSAEDNPFAYENMVCDVDGEAVDMAFTDGSNPRYVKGLCPAPAIALSTTTIVDCGMEDNTLCADQFPWDAYFADIEGGTPIAKVAEWRWCEVGESFNITTDGHIDFACDDSDIDDNSWDNPYDVAKGHRGFIEGDFIMLLYAWSPNWNANTVGHDNYNLYTRRSFDGGQTWTTTPTDYLHTDGVTYSGSGTITCEWMGAAGTATEFPVCTEYGAGDFEQARNVSQLVGTQETILDPRYAPTRSSIPVDATVETLSYHYPDDARDPSRYFMVYETGDNTTVELGEAEPLDLFYSRAVDWGDHYLVWAELTDLSACLPNASTEEGDLLTGTEFCNEFDWLEGSQRAMSGEGSVTANPGGTFFYALWNQEDLDKKGNVIGSDAWFRRVAFIDDYVPSDTSTEDPPDDDPPGNSGNNRKNP